MALFDRDLGSMFRADLGGLNPREAAAGTVNGVWIDRRSVRASDSMPNVYDGLYAMCMTGAVGSGGTGPSVVFSVQDADDSSGTNAKAYTPPNASAPAAVTLSGQSIAAGLSVDISGARQFVRVQAAVTVGGGGTVGVAAGVALGGARQRPA